MESQAGNNTLLTGYLEIDHARGVIYFHITDETQIK